MFSEGFSFPHPVLGISDDVHGSFSFKIDLERNNSNRTLGFKNASIEVNNLYYEHLIGEKICEYILKIYCSSTFKTWIIRDPVSPFEIPESDIANKIDLVLMIVATKLIERYQHESFNGQYGGEIFKVGIHEIVGISGKITLPIEKEDEKLGLGSIFKFYHHESSKPLYFEFAHDKIHINYPVTELDEHPPQICFKKYPWTSFSVYIIPALAEALRLIGEHPEEYCDFEWFTVIDNLYPIDERTGEYFHDAQQLLAVGLPTLNSYKELFNQ